jgi:hypothetical protein
MSAQVEGHALAVAKVENEDASEAIATTKATVYGKAV